MLSTYFLNKLIFAFTNANLNHKKKKNPSKMYESVLWILISALRLMEYICATRKFLQMPYCAEEYLRGKIIFYI